MKLTVILQEAKRTVTGISLFFDLAIDFLVRG